MSAGVGSIVSLYMDTLSTLEVGHAIQTGTGRLYEITALRQQQKGKHRGRWHIQAIVARPDTAATYPRVIPLRWYRR